jgi:hypothetical protein
MNRFTGYSPGGTTIGSNTVLHCAITNTDNTLKVTVTTSYKIKTSFLSSVGRFSPWGRFRPNRTRSPPSTGELSRSLLLLCCGGLLPSERKRFCMHCLGIDVALCTALLLQSYSLPWKRVPTVRRPAAATSVLPREHDQRSPAQQIGRLQLSGVMSRYVQETLTAQVFGSTFSGQRVCTKRTSVLFGDPHERFKRSRIRLAIHSLATT